MLAASKAIEIARENGIMKLLLRAYHRKVLCHLLRGEIDSPATTQTIEDALFLCERNGDVKSKASMYSNLGAAYLNVGDLGRATNFLNSAEKLVCGPGERALIQANLGALYYELGEYQAAEGHYQDALKQAELQQVPGLVPIIVFAGLGFCALATGRMSRAKELEVPVRKALETWIHEPWPLIHFLAELERRRGRLREALEIVRRRVAEDTRRPVYSLRNRTLELKYLRLLDGRAANELENQLREEARSHGLERIMNLWINCIK
jgi:tetratricopeptide (TPR) repeat protein